jgi:hypothetical protein
LRNPEFVNKAKSRLPVQKTCKLFIGGDEKTGSQLQQGGELNVKRYVRRQLTSTQRQGRGAEGPYWIPDTVEMKTAGHPIGL